jgi:hypothetical protein
MLMDQFFLFFNFQVSFITDAASNYIEANSLSSDDEIVIDTPGFYDFVSQCHYNASYKSKKTGKFVLLPNESQEYTLYPL